MGIIAKGPSSRNGTAPTTFLRNAFEKNRGWLTQIGVLASRPAAFAVFALYAIAWITLGDGLEWHSIAVLATWGMTLVIQRAEHRDTQALHAKLDELLKVNGDANSQLMRIDDKDAEQVEREREKLSTSIRGTSADRPIGSRSRTGPRPR